MTYAPASIRTARTFLLEHVPGLKGEAVGIVGSTGHASTGTSYHLGEDQLKNGAYSVVESSRDRAGLTEAASAIDIGTFSFTAGGRIHTLRTFSRWLVVQCKAGTADTRDIREVIYSPDGTAVRRWDRIGRRTTGDTSHRTHTHVSYFRDSEGRDKTGLYRRYLIETGLLEDDVTEAQITAAVIKALQSPEARSARIDAMRGWTEDDPASTTTPPAKARVGGAIRMQEQRAALRHSAAIVLLTKITDQLAKLLAK